MSPGRERAQRFVTFCLGRETYGLPIDLVESIVCWEAPTHLPGLPEFLAGLHNLRGQTIPIVDLRKRLGLPAEPCGPQHRIIITRLKGRLIGLIVDTVREALPIESGQIETNIPLVTDRQSADGSEDACLRGVANLTQGFVILLDIERLLSSYETAQLNVWKTIAA